MRKTGDIFNQRRSMLAKNVDHTRLWSKTVRENMGRKVDLLVLISLKDDKKPRMNNAVRGLVRVTSFI